MYSSSGSPGSPALSSGSPSVKLDNLMTYDLELPSAVSKQTLDPFESEKTPAVGM